MKHYFQLLLLICLFLSGSAFVKAQGNVPTLKHVQGISSLGLQGGYVTDGFNAGLGYTYYLKSRAMLRFKVDYESTKMKITKLTFIYINPEIMYSFIKIGNSLYFNVKGGPIVGFENIKNTLVTAKKNTVVYGGEAGLNAECFFNSKLSLNLDYDQRLVANSS